jgi:hypothetical protein
MSNGLVAAITVAAFLFAIALVRVLCRMIDRDADAAGFWDQPPDTPGRASALGPDEDRGAS